MQKTKLAVKSSYISIIVTLLQGILTFWHTKVIISNYGIEVNSIIQTAMQFFSFFVLLESGLSAAYLYHMYKPMAERKYNKVYSLYLGLSKKLKKIAIKMFFLLIVVALIYPVFIARNEISYFQSSSIVLILGLRYIFPYYFTISKKNLFIVEEKRYIIVVIDSLINSSIILSEITLIEYFNVKVEIALILSFLFLYLSNKIYILLFEKKYPRNLEVSPSYEGDELTNDILSHQVASLINAHTDLIILSFFDLSLVTIYSAYNSLMQYPVNLFSKLMENLRGSIGLSLSSDTNNLYPVFREIVVLNYFLSGIIVPVFVLMINDFVTLWIGNAFLLDYSSIILFALILYHRINMSFIYIVRDSKGLYRESKKFTILTTILNILLSMILIKPFSINGLLFSTVITSYLIMDYGNLKLVYSKVFNKKLSIICKELLINSLSIMISILFSEKFYNILFDNYRLSWVTFSYKTLLSTIVSTCVVFVILLFFEKSFSNLLKRINKVYFKLT